MQLYGADDGTEFGWSSESDTNPKQSDFIQNGLYCQSGLAYQSSEYGARCTSFKEMKFKDEVIEYPYACDPSD
jgi:hypothetical protein